MLHVRCIDRLEEFDAMRSAWNSLIDPAVAQAIFLRHEFVRTWFEAYGSGGTPHLLVATRGGSLRGILPLRSWRERFAGLPVRRLDLMANGHSPCADLIAAPGLEAEVVSAFAAHLQDNEPAWDASGLAEIHVDANLARLIERFPRGGRSVVPQRRAPYMRLGMQWEELRGGLSKNFQRVLRNNRNRIARSGTARIELLEEPAALAAGLADMFAIGERSWQGASGSAVGSNAANRLFYSRLVDELGALGVVRLWFLNLGGRRVAFELHVVHAGVEFGLKTGYDRDTEQQGTGTFLDQSIVEQLCAERHVTEYDLLGDSDAYKLRWTPLGRDYVRATLFGAGANARFLSLWNLKFKPVLRRAPAAHRLRAAMFRAVIVGDCVAAAAHGMGQ